MLKHTVVFKDFNGVEQTVDLWFNISRTNLVMAKDETYESIIKMGQDLQKAAALVDEAQKTLDEKAKTEQEGDDKSVGLTDENLVIARAVRLMGQLLDKIIDLAYGERTPDGMGFSKTPEALSAFKQSLAYDALIDSLLDDPDAMVSFVQNLMKQ